MAYILGFSSGSEVKNLPANAGDAGSITGSGRSLEEEMATYSSILAWEITWIESGGLQPMRSQESISTTLPKSIGSSKSKRVPEKSIYFCFIDYTKAFDCVNHNKLWKILREMRIPDHLTCLLRYLYAGQEATVRTRYKTTD